MGLEIAKQLLEKGDEVIITGRKDPGVHGLEFHTFDLDLGPDLPRAVEEFVVALPHIDRIVYSAGFYQEGNVTELQDQDIKNMLDVGINAPIWFFRELLQQQGEIAEAVAITSSSQYKPREKEVIYTATKAALGHFANSLSLDPRVQKVLVAAPEGMATPFWRATGHDTKDYNDPVWVAKEIVNALDVDFEYAFVKILRNPPRTELVESR